MYFSCILKGRKSWLDHSIGFDIKDSRPNSYTHIEIIESAGHKVFSDDEIIFNSIVLNACKILKSNEDRADVTFTEDRFQELPATL